MSRISPTVEGFRAALRRPSLTFAEMAWRWTTGGTAMILFAFGLLEYLGSLPVTRGDVLFLRSRHPLLIGQAIAHILHGSLTRAAIAGLIGAVGLAALWVIAASVGRVATVRALVDYFANRKDVARNVSDDPANDAARGAAATDTRPAQLSSLIDLNSLRVAIVLAGTLSLLGASILAGFASPKSNPQPGLAFLLFMPLAGLICFVSWALNWLLSLAAMFAARDGRDAPGALSEAVTFCRERSGAIFAVSTWTGFAHFAAFVAATAAVGVPLGLIRIAPVRLVIVGVVLVSLAYFAVADWLYMARLAGYVCIAEMPQALLEPSPPTAPLPAPPTIQSTIDRDEPILSDFPLPSVSG